jgi:uncharacterized protein
MRKKLGYLFIFIVSVISLIFGGIHWLAYRDMPEAEVLLGIFYQDGFGVFPKNTPKAKNYFLSAAEKGDAEGQCALGELYANEMSYQDAAYWYLKSALQGVQRCEYKFGQLHFPNEENVFNLLKKEADQSNAFAEFSVGMRYVTGNGVEKNIAQGIGYLKKSALHRNKGARIYLADIYLKGEIVKQNYDEANKWLDGK